MIVNRILAGGAALGLAATALVGVSQTASAGFEPNIGDCMKVAKGKYFSGVKSATYLSNCQGQHNAQVYQIVPYPSDLPKPSKLGKRTEELGWGCSYRARMEYIGASNSKVPIFPSSGFTVPSDAAWQTGEAFITCFMGEPNSRGVPVNFTGTIKQRYDSTPTSKWTLCRTKAPVSGKWNDGGRCTAKSKWLTINGGMLKGKLGPDYPRDVQAKADAVCLKNAKGLLKSGSKSKPIAALGPREAFPQGDPFFECYIAYSEWTGKPR
jgi:hypothetical protein